ncbi:MAG: DNA mismatch repair endonuclease MutL [Roseburia sp.]
MAQITLLSQETIDKIAAGEVVERPASVVKELVENAIDAQATAITVEIKEGGISFLRITDNGCGIEREQVPLAFLRHSTSKIKCVEDLLCIRSLGFRGEALSSIAAVAQVELITKTYGELTGTRYVIEGSREKENEETGAPEGTTFLVRNLFYNVPARRKFLKAAQTEGNYVSDLIERLALSHPDISFKFINNGQTKLHTSGNSSEKDMIYHIYGRDITSSLVPVELENEYFSVKGFLGKPQISRGNRNYENFFINGRYIKSALLSKAVEDAYKGFLMQHQYPFCLLYFSMRSELFDVNVHPTKMELRFWENEEIYGRLNQIVRDALTHKEWIPDVSVERKKEKKPSVLREDAPEPFEQRRLNEVRKAIRKDSPYERQYEHRTPENADVFERLLKGETKGQEAEGATQQKAEACAISEEISYSAVKQEAAPMAEKDTQQEKKTEQYMQQSLLTAEKESGFLTKDAAKKHRIIGQLFDTYWLIQYEDKLFIIDQHAAHEKVLYERSMKRIKENSFASQVISPPIILTLDAQEAEVLSSCLKQIEAFGYSVAHFGGKEYAISAVPADFEAIDVKTMFLELLADCADLGRKDAPEQILEKVASMSCKAAVKGRQRLGMAEAEKLIDALLLLENPYQCPHGRPTIISMSKYELEKKFKRIVN